MPGGALQQIPSAELIGLGKLFGHTAVLRGVTLSLGPAEVVALLGANGSGKTTLLKLVAGLLTPTAGQVIIGGHDLARERVAARPLIGLLAAETYLYEELSARENLAFAVAMAGHRAAPADITAVLDRVGLGAVGELRVRRFSSGMRRRLSLGRLLLLKPRLWLLDEPYTALDAEGLDLVDTVVREARAREETVLLATHDVERVLGQCDRVVVLTRGAISYAGTPRDYAAERRHVG